VRVLSFEASDREAYMAASETVLSNIDALVAVCPDLHLSVASPDGMRMWLSWRSLAQRVASRAARTSASQVVGVLGARREANQAGSDRIPPAFAAVRRAAQAAEARGGSDQPGRPVKDDQGTVDFG
jgi:hypothetical protein